MRREHYARNELKFLPQTGRWVPKIAAAIATVVDSRLAGRREPLERVKLVSTWRRCVWGVGLAQVGLLINPLTGQVRDEQYDRQRASMVQTIVRYGVTDQATLAALRSVPRHEFVPAEYQRQAYEDRPLPIGLGQTISQPYIVAYMTEILRPRPGMKVLEVGTGSGYQAAVLGQIGCEVYTVEIFETLSNAARDRLQRLGFDGVTTRHGDGHFGWEEHAPFDVVIVTAVAGFIPPALVEQLKPGGRMIIPVGSVYGIQNLILVEKDVGGTMRTHTLLPVRFVPMLSGLR